MEDHEIRTPKLRQLFVAFGIFFIFLNLQNLRHVNARGLYVDVGVGASQIRNGSNLFSGLDSSPSLGFAFNFGILNNFMPANSFLQVHIGVKHYYTSSGSGTDTAGLHIPYGVVRFEMPRLYITAGVSPFSWTRFAPGIGIDQLTFSTGNLSFLAELGLLWRVTHFFHLALEFSVQTQLSTQGLSPMPAAAGTFQMRFFIIEPKAASSTRRPFDGWRYPFGIRID